MPAETSLPVVISDASSASAITFTTAAEPYPRLVRTADATKWSVSAVYMSVAVKMEQAPDTPVECRPVLVRFPGDPLTVAFAERYGDGSWGVALELDVTTVTEGATLEEAKANLVLSAEEDYAILSKNKGSLAPHLERKRKLLEYLFS